MQCAFFSRALKSTLLALCFFLLCGGLSAQSVNEDQNLSDYEIHLFDETLVPEPGLAPKARQALSQKASWGSETVHVLVQFWEIPSNVEKRSLRDDELDLGSYASGNAWMAAVPAAKALELDARDEVRAVLLWNADRKLHPSLRSGEFSARNRHQKLKGWVGVLMHLHHDVDLELGKQIAERVGGVAVSPSELLHAVTVWLPETRVRELAQTEEVLWLDEGMTPLYSTNDGIRSQAGVDSLIDAPYELDGEGVRLFVFDSTVRASHETFGDRMTVIDTPNPDAAPSFHGTHVAGTALGSGAGSPEGKGRGIAPGATGLNAESVIAFDGIHDIFYALVGDMEDDFRLARQDWEADLANMSLSSNPSINRGNCRLYGGYGNGSKLLDIFGNNTHPGLGWDDPLIAVIAAGNERSHPHCDSFNYGSVAEPGCSKNPIRVGAVNSDGASLTHFSGWGPCSGGRLTPVVVAPGCETGRVTGENAIYSSLDDADDSYSDSFTVDSVDIPICGTSMASPAVAGLVALLIEDWRAQGHGDSTERPLPALVKALLIQTSKDLGLVGPDYQHGYGLVDGQKLMDHLRAGDGVLGTKTTNWGTGELQHLENDEYQIVVPEHTGELKVSMAWDDVESASFASGDLINNLDLVLISPNSVEHYPWELDGSEPTLPATREINNADNQEQVIVVDPAPGTWTLRAHARNIPEGAQTYGLAYSSTARLHDGSRCETTTWNWEDGASGWIFEGGAQLEDAPAEGHGVTSLRLGTEGNLVPADWAYQTIEVPVDAVEANLSYSVYIRSGRSRFNSGLHRGSFTMEVLDTSNQPLAVMDLRDYYYEQEQWAPQQIVDLTPWAGQTIRLSFRNRNEIEKVVNYWVDDVQLRMCGATDSGTEEVFTSIPGEDGWLRESGESTGKGGKSNAINTSRTALRTGDDKVNRQYKSVVSFDTSSIPDDATIVSASLRLKRGKNVGRNPFRTHGTCWVDVEPDNGFGPSTALRKRDFQASATALRAGSLSNATRNGSWSEASLDSAGLSAINLAGTTQLRVYFDTDNNGDLENNYIGWYSGDHADSANWPQLIVVYE